MTRSDDSSHPRIVLVADLRVAPSGAPENARRAFAALLGDRRMRVGPDAERGFRVEGLFEWVPGSQRAARARGTGRLASEVAGGLHRPARTTPVVLRLELPWAA